MVQEENLEARPEEYMVMEYEDGESEEESDKGEDIKETPNEPYPSETPPDQHKAVVRARQMEDVITQEENELAELLVRQLDI
ncbi:unnamed protein product [Lactuca saligna]|uniref:Uncharacterized protein n=1 Tax=Lactuca saligna TaxID=75948 RepID=A0AA36A2V7_LACSI|nr:unnamed protein product [Lactuca saligna]